jgi:hypothetical protein
VQHPRPAHLTLLAALLGALSLALVGLAAPARAAEVPMLTVTLSDGDAHPLRGSTYTYRASVRNDGTETLRAARLVAVIPTSEVTLLPASVRTTAGEITIANIFGQLNNLISIELGALTPGERLTASWTVRLRADLPPGLEGFGLAATVERTADDGYPSTIEGDYDLVTEPATAVLATLSGAGVQPGPGDQDGTGSARLRVVPATGALCSVVTVRRIVLPASRTLLRIGDATPIALPGPDASGTARGCTTIDPALARTLVMGSANSLQVDNARFPAGAVAGPLVRATSTAPA